MISIAIYIAIHQLGGMMKTVQMTLDESLIVSVDKVPNVSVQLALRSQGKLLSLPSGKFGSMN